jgi:hypothetical protein
MATTHVGQDRLIPLETSQGVAVEQLLEAGMIVYPLNPKSAQAYRERKAPSGVKDDWLDERQRIEELFARHPDHDLFGSLPGAGPKIAPRLLSEIGDDRQRFGVDPQNLHANPLRRPSHRWLKIIYKMWIDRTPYNAELHHRNQLQHGSWIFQLQQS